MMLRTQKIQRRMLAAFAFTLTLMVVGTAFADRVKWRRTTVNESNESWRIDLEFHMSKAPDIAHVPMRFEFQPTVYYERSLVDGKDKPIERRVPLEFKQPLIETVDVGFLDPGSGKTQPRTRFTFKLTRARGFEAGEYKVTVTNKRNGRKLGAPTTLILNGENEVIDRRSMVFEGKKKKKKKKEDEHKDQEEEKQPDPSSDEYWEGGEPEAPEADLPPPAHMQEKPGPCGCRVPGGLETTGGSALFLLLGLVAAPVLRRRRR